MIAPVVITGAGGFIGTALLRCLESRGVSVRGLCHRHRTPHAGVPAGVTWRHGSVLATPILDELLADADAVVHLAGPPSVAESFRVPDEFARTHVEGTVAVLEACRRAGVRRFVYLSSAEVYGSPRTEFIAEDHPCEPRSPYGVCKLAGEHMVRVYASAGYVSATVLRAFSVYGPGQSSASVLAEIIRQTDCGDLVQLADLRPIRDFTHVDDIAVGITKALNSDRDGYHVMNLGSGVGVQIADLAALVLSLRGQLGEVRGKSNDRPACATVGRLVADSRRAAHELNWRPHISLADGLRDLLRIPSSLAQS